jgi:hypothetical protein
MADDLVIVPSGRNEDGDGFVSLARTKTGRLFKKHLLNYGPLRHPATGGIINIDDTFVTTMKRNFDNGVCDIVQVPLANAKNEHTEDPERNIGEVVDIQVEDKKVYAVLDVRDDTHAAKLGKTYLGASAMLSLDYTDTKSGTKVGPTLLHACVTNRPYVTGLESYQEIVAATADNSQGAVLLTTDLAEKPADTAPNDTTEVQTPEATDMPEKTEPTQETTKPSLEELLTALKTDHGIDVTGLQAKAAEGEQAAQMTAALTKALGDAGLVKLSTEDTEVKTETIVGAVAEVAGKVVALTDQVNTLQRRDAEHAVQTLIDEGRVLPAQKTGFVDLKLSNPSMFDQLIPAEPIVKLNNEQGVTPPKDEKHIENVDKEILRLSEQFNTLAGKPKQ